MTNIVVLADLHIWDFKLYNPEPHARLKQVDKFADRLLRVADEYNSHDMFILGDLINAPLAPPKVIHTLKNFLVKLSQKYTIRIIKGQHDQDSKSQIFKEEDSFVNIITGLPKIEYANDKYYKIENCIIYCHDYINTDIITLPDTHIDIYMSHMSLGFGQDTDGSKFKLGLFGDIHDPVKYGNKYSIGTPYQLYPHQPEQGNIGILTINDSDCSFKRINSDDELFSTIKLKETEQYKDSVMFTSMDDESKATNIELSEDIYKQLNGLIKNEGLEWVHEAIDKSDLPTPINFNFKILSLNIRNFKSISSLDLDFTKLGKVIYLSGHNGSGKTATIEALITALLGDRRIRSFDRVDKDGNEYNCDLTVKVLYNNIVYTINRGPGYTQYWINDEQVSRNNKSLLESQIYEDLPFLSYLYYFIVRANSHFFNNIDRTELIKTCFNLSVFDYFTDKANILNSEYYTKLSEYTAKTEAEKSNISNFEESKNKLLSELTEIGKVSYDESELKNKLTDIQTKYNTLTNNYNLLNSYESFVNKYENDLKSNKLLEINKQLMDKGISDPIDRVKSEINDFKLKDLVTRKVKTLNDSLESAKASLSNYTGKYTVCTNCGTKLDLTSSIKDTLVNNVNTKQLELDSYLNSDEYAKYTELPQATIFKSIYEDNEYLSLIDQYNNAVKSVDEYKLKYNTLAKEITIQLAEYNAILNGLTYESYINSINIELDKILKVRMINTQVSSINTYIKTSESNINKYNDCINEINNKIKDINRYISLFNIKDLNSISYKLIKKVTESMNSDKVKFTTIRELASGDERFNVNASILIQGAWRDYDSASDGQKCILDLFILNRITSLLGTPGLLILDEALANIDADHYELAREFLTEASVRNIIITSHSEQFNGENTRLNYNLVDGISKISAN